MNKQIATEAYKKMSRIRQFEMWIEDSLSGKKSSRLAGKKGSPLMGLMHTQMGEEAYSVAVIMQLKATDYLSTTYRNHAHTIARDINLKGLAAELCGMKEGVCKGRAGNMHAVDVNLNILAGFGIIGAGLPSTVGSAFTSNYKGQDNVSVGFFGDGAMAQGAVHESLNLASVLKLPVLFVNNNNKYAMSTPSSYNLVNESTVDYAKAYNMPAVSVDGMDFFETYEAVTKAIDYVRSGKGPYFLECTCFRYSGQWVGDPQTYKTKEEIDYYNTQDPIDKFKASAIEKGLLSEEELKTIEDEIKDEVEAAFEYAAGCELQDEITTDTYADKY